MRRFDVNWTAAARDDLFGIISYLADADPDAADHTLDAIERRAMSLERFPARGRVVPELGRLQVGLYRELQIPPYRIIYKLHGKKVLVLAVFDSRRNLEDVLLDRLLRG